MQADDGAGLTRIVSGELGTPGEVPKLQDKANGLTVPVKLAGDSLQELTLRYTGTDRDGRVIFRGEQPVTGPELEIKAGLEKDTILRLDVEDGEGALAALQGRPAVTEAYMQGAMLQVNIGHLSASEADLPAVLGSAGFLVRGVERVEPTLEDAFVHLVTGQGGRA